MTSLKNDIPPNDIPPNEITPNDITPNDITPNYITPSDNTANAISPSAIVCYNLLGHFSNASMTSIAAFCPILRPSGISFEIKFTLTTSVFDNPPKMNKNLCLICYLNHQMFNQGTLTEG
jgi:hypothetical protein